MNDSLSVLHLRNTGDDDEGIDLSYYLSLARTVFFKYYQLVLAINVVGLVAVLLYHQSLTPGYTSSVVLHIAPKDTNVFKFDQIYWGGGSDPSFRFTQIGILTSTKLMRQVVADLELHKKGVLDPAEVRDGFVGYVQDKIWPQVPMSMMPDDLGIELTAYKLMSLMEITGADQDNYSNLMYVSVTMADPELSAETANAIGQAYVDTVFENEMQNAMKSQQFLQERLSVLREELQQAEQRLRDFLEAEDILSRGSGRSEVDEELDTTSQRFFAAQAERERLENLISQVRSIQRGGTEISSVPAIASQPLVAKVSTDILALEQRKSELSRRYGPRHNTMIALESELAQARSSLDETIANVLQGIQSDLAIARRAEESTRVGYDSARSRIQEIGRKDFKITELQQDIDVKRAVYTMFLERLNQEDASGPVRNNNIWIADPATVPRQGAVTPIWMLAAASIFLCSALGFGFGLGREFLDNTLETEEDVHEKIGVPLLGLLPQVPANEISGDKLFREYLDNLHSRFAEAIRSVRTSITLLNVRGHYRRLLITSTVEHEGKTSIAMTLSASLGQTGKVILIDADLRRPSVERVLELDEGHRLLGVSDVISGSVGWRDCVFRHDESGIDILMAGSRSLKPLELLSSSEFTTLLNDLSDNYDYIVIDSPPCSAVSDAYLLSSMVDAVLFVVKSKWTSVTQIRGVINRLRHLNATIAGVLLNQIDFDARHHPQYTQYQRYDTYGAPDEPVKITQV